MRWLIIPALLMAAADAHSGSFTGDPPLTQAIKTQYHHVLDDALRDRDITREQYAQSISWINATPCKGVDRDLTREKQARIQVAVAREQGRKAVQVFDYFQYGQWRIVDSDASDGDEPYLFYSADPSRGSHPVTAWSGAATIFETGEIADWVKRNAPGIPAKLADCFAWHVTLDRDRSGRVQ